MKIKTVIRQIISNSVIATLMLNFSACENQTPLAPSNSESQNEIQIISFDNLSPTLNKGSIQDSTVVTVAEGGNLSLTYNYNPDNATDSTDFNGDFEELNPIEFSKDSRVFIKFDVLPGAVDNDTTVYIRLNTQRIDLNFSPHGLVFNKPAKLTIIAGGLNLKKVNTETLALYYDNQDTGQWERMNYETFVVIEEYGYIKIVGAEIPHFSRYALAWSR